MKAEGHLGRCYLKGRAGDAANVILSAVGYNLRLVLAWLRIIFARHPTRATPDLHNSAQPSNRLLNGRLGITRAAEQAPPKEYVVCVLDEDKNPTDCVPYDDFVSEDGPSRSKRIVNR